MLLDDGGLLMLLPHVMRKHVFWKNCKVRMNLIVDKEYQVNAAANNSDENDENNENNANDSVLVIDNLIKQFRLPFEIPRVILVTNSEPSAETISKFERLSNGISVENTPRPNVTKRWLRLSELLIEYSKNSGLVIVTLPLPTAEYEAKVYMALLHCISDQKIMPPTLIMRGNGESSLTFYSE